MTKRKDGSDTDRNRHRNDNEPIARAPDPVALTQALLDVYTRAQPVFEEYMRRQGSGEWARQNIDPLNASKAWIALAEKVMENPQKFWEMQADYWTRWMTLWQVSALKFLGEKDTQAIIEPPRGDRRFKAPEWQEIALFDFLKQSYLLTCDWMDRTVRSAEGLDDKTREKLAFTARLFADALSPSNFVMTNPEVLKETLSTGGENLVRGLENLVEDLERGGGELKISTTDYDAFELGRNIAVTPGRIVFQNDLIQLIQYEPMTEKSHRRPLLVIPPWINKYYILDLRPDNSFVRWALTQGHTVFVISWVNPTPRLARKTFTDYMKEGILQSLDTIRDITGEKDCNAVGYCLGGTLLAITLAWLAARGEGGRVASATYLTTLLDFEQSGDMKLFLDDEQLESIESEMAEKGVFEAKNLQRTFSLLRANDLIWSFVVNNYLLGREPFPFDLLYWNDDSTNMPGAMHSFYLRNMYRDNRLTKPGGIEIDGTPIDLRKIKTPSYFLSTREDHIAPWKATYAGTQMMAGPVRFTLAASGHIAGVINPPAKEKYCFWTSDNVPGQADSWFESAQESGGSWWPHWQSWVAQYAGGEVPARHPEAGLEAAPGSYVKAKP